MIQQFTVSPVTSSKCRSSVDEFGFLCWTTRIPPTLTKDKKKIIINIHIKRLRILSKMESLTKTIRKCQTYALSSTFVELIYFGNYALSGKKPNETKKKKIVHNEKDEAKNI